MTYDVLRKRDERIIINNDDAQPKQRKKIEADA